VQHLIETAETEEHIFHGKELVISYLLYNGFSIAGRAAVVDKHNFDLEIGRIVARKDAERQIWQIEGYRLQDELFGQEAQPASASE
jgi:Phage protein (N4 Gp49/phage Sf6 gene 66) family